ncbi:alpha/beta family hydrolase [Thalassotalea atypica]|uniref:alpha/beta family hydrolase n=1 Tax=Thalassotalea atypica TaxID=2054316 RepID=UPI00257407CF|nr:alpha/beta family hydrolase [Thalassotalea atypica]
MKTSSIMEHAENPKALFVFAHGAGADMNSSFMKIMSELLLGRNISVMKFNFPYMDKRGQDGKRRPPDRMPVLLDTLAHHLNVLENKLPIMLGGKSMGSRVCATWLADTIDHGSNCILGLVALGYPFHPIGKPEKLRLKPLQDNSLPTLIIQGERDKLGCKNEIANYHLPKECNIKYMIDGDHDLKPRVKSGYTHQQHIQQASELVEKFIDERLQY